jgi:hypothetical protein
MLRQPPCFLYEIIFINIRGTIVALKVVIRNVITS